MKSKRTQILITLFCSNTYWYL